jgi:Putative adhesin
MKKINLILNLINSNEKFSLLFLLALCCLSFQIISAQETPEPPTKVVITPKVNTVITSPTPNPKATPNQKVVIAPRPTSTPPKSSEAKKVIVNEGFAPAEKSIAVEPKVNITLCVKEGNVRINGWDRDEIRAFVQEGSQVGFKVSQKNLKTGKPEWVYVLGFDPQKTKELKPEECLSGSEIELDVPRNATVNLKSLESEIKIESVAKVWVANLGGDISLNDIAKGVEATTYRGDITVERSSGQMILTNTDGNILALEVSPSEIGDIFKAKTNSGRITLQAVEHRQIETGSISGSTSFDGELLSGGQYSLATQNGSIILAIPLSSQCKINAWFPYGKFDPDPEIPLKNTLKKEQSLSAQLGSTDATCSLNLKTGSGIIRIKATKSVSRPVSKYFEKSTKFFSTKKSFSINRNKKAICSSNSNREALLTILKSGNR